MPIAADVWSRLLFVALSRSALTGWETLHAYYVLLRAFRFPKHSYEYQHTRYPVRETTEQSNACFTLVCYMCHLNMTSTAVVCGSTPSLQLAHKAFEYQRVLVNSFLLGHGLPCLPKAGNPSLLSC